MQETNTESNRLWDIVAESRRHWREASCAEPSARADLPPGSHTAQASVAERLSNYSQPLDYTQLSSTLTHTATPSLAAPDYTQLASALKQSTSDPLGDATIDAHSSPPSANIWEHRNQTGFDRLAESELPLAPQHLADGQSTAMSSPDTSDEPSYRALADKLRATAAGSPPNASLRPERSAEDGLDGAPDERLPARTSTAFERGPGMARGYFPLDVNPHRFRLPGPPTAPQRSDEADAPPFGIDTPPSPPGSGQGEGAFYHSLAHELQHGEKGAAIVQTIQHNYPEPGHALTIAARHGRESEPDGRMHLTNDCILFGGNNQGKAADSAQISAGKHQPDSLNIVGMSSGKDHTDRRVDIWAEGGLMVRAGKVGIGTTSPQNTLDVSGGMVIGAALAGAQEAPANGLRVEGDTELGDSASNTVTIKGKLMSSTASDALEIDDAVRIRGNLTVDGQSINGDLNIGVGKLKIADTSVTATAAELNKLHGVTASKEQLNRITAVAGTLQASKALVVDVNKKINEFAVDNIHLDGNTIKATNANGLYLQDAGANGMFIQEGGKVGIGTNDPQGKLHIIGVPQSPSDGTSLIIGPTTSSNVRLGYTNDFCWIQTHHSKPLAINSVCNKVGIGTARPQTTLQVKGNGHQLFSVSRKGIDTPALYLGNDDTTNNHAVIASNNADLRLGRDLSGTFTERVRITNAGKVGIGTTSPQNTLDVSGGMVIGAALAGAQEAPANGLRVEGDTELGHSASNTVTIKGKLMSSTASDALEIDDNVQIIGNLTVGGQSINGDLNIGLGKLKIADTSVTATAAELNKLHGVTASTEQLNRITASAGTLQASKALVVDVNKKINEFAVDNIHLDGNTIKATNPNGLHLQDAGGIGMFIQEGGNVGIGIGMHDPKQKLVVNGNAIIGEPDETLKVGNIGHSGWAGLAHTSRANTNDYALMQNPSGNTVLNSKSDQPLSFRRGNLDKMVIDDIITIRNTAMAGTPNDYMKAQFVMSGGGQVTWRGPGGRLKWTQRFIAISMSRGNNCSTSGYIDISQPISAIPAANVYDGSSRSATADGIVLNGWEALYAVHQIGETQSSVSFKIVRHTNDFSAPSNWLLVAVVNNDNQSVRLGTGVIINKNATYSNGSPIPRGVITMWSGAANNIPHGWALCDGNNSTPDLRGRFVLSQGASGHNVGGFGGTEKHTLTLAEIPRHRHGMTTRQDDYNVDGGSGPSFGKDNGTFTNHHYTSYEGSGHAHNNMPPYFVLAFIMKL